MAQSSTGTGGGSATPIINNPIVYGPTFATNMVGPFGVTNYTGETNCFLVAIPSNAITNGSKVKITALDQFFGGGGNSGILVRWGGATLAAGNTIINATTNSALVIPFFKELWFINPIGITNGFCMQANDYRYWETDSVAPTALTNSLNSAINVWFNFSGTTGTNVLWGARLEVWK